MGYYERLQIPAGSATAITPNDDTDLATETRSLYVGGAGNVSVILANDADPVTLTALAVGVLHELRVRRVRATGTTATGLVGLT